MKRYVNCSDNGQQDTIHTTAKGARDYAAQWGGYYAVAVEIDLPDPPHQWKVGDWLQWWPQDQPNQIVAIVDGFAVFWWKSAGTVEVGRFEIGSDQDHATPCDPPDWFTGDVLGVMA